MTCSCSLVFLTQYVTTEVGGADWTRKLPITKQSTRNVDFTDFVVSIMMPNGWRYMQKSVLWGNVSTIWVATFVPTPPAEFVCFSRTCPGHPFSPKSTGQLKSSDLWSNALVKLQSQHAVQHIYSAAKILGHLDTMTRRFCKRVTCHTSGWIYSLTFGCWRRRRFAPLRSSDELSQFGEGWSGLGQQEARREFVMAFEGRLAYVSITVSRELVHGHGSSSWATVNFHLMDGERLIARPSPFTKCWFANTFYSQ